MFQQKPVNKRSAAHRKLIQGVGINDADYIVRPTTNGKQVTCPFYRTWSGIFERCYDSKCQDKQPTYIGCTVTKDWHLFSNFRAWMVEQDWQGNALDKDILFSGNKVYGPKTCVFVSQEINSLLNDSAASRGVHPIGVCYDKQSGKYRSKIRINGRAKHIGLFYSQEAAHSAYLTTKASHVRDSAQDQQQSVKSALMRIAVKIERKEYYDNHGQVR